MKTKNLYYQIASPCTKCPYTLGLVHTLVNPCPRCKLDGYQAYKRFTNKAHSASGSMDVTGKQS